MDGVVVDTAHLGILSLGQTIEKHSLNKFSFLFSKHGDYRAELVQHKQMRDCFGYIFGFGLYVVSTVVIFIVKGING